MVGIQARLFLPVLPVMLLLVCSYYIGPNRVNVPNFGHLDTFACKNENEVILVKVAIQV